MESKLELIIAGLEDEERAIKTSIKEFMEEGDYYFAFLQSKGLHDISSQIHRLKKIEDPSFERRHFLQTRIQNIQKGLSKQLTKQFKDYLLNELEAVETELEIFEQRQKEGLPKPQQTILDDCLSLLFTKKVKAVAVNFSRKESLSAILTLRGKTLTIRITGLKAALSEGWIDNYHIKKTEQLGFSRMSSASDLKLKLQGAQDDLISKSKTILARLTFDVLPDSFEAQDAFIKLS